MEYVNSTIDSIQGKKILIVSFTGSTPHLETSLEVARRLSIRNAVSYIHLGQYVSRPTLFPANKLKREVQLRIRILRAKNYIIESNKASPVKIKWINPSEIVEQMMQRISLLKNHILNPEVNTLDQLKRLEFENLNIGIGIASTLISSLKDPDPFPLSRKVKYELNQLLRSAIKSIKLAKEILKDQGKYDSIVLLNGRFTCENAVKQVAYAKNLDVYFHECGPPYQFNRFFFEQYMPHNFQERKKEILKVKEQITPELITEIGKEFFKRKTSGDGVYEQSYVKGQSEYLSPQLNKLIRECKKKKMKIISYYTSSNDEFQFIDPNSTRYPYWGSQELAITSIAKIVKSLGYLFIVRVHPNLRSKSLIEQRRWHDIGSNIQNEYVKWISHFDKESTYLLLKESDLIITSGSSVGIEAIALGKPSISITQCYYDEVISEVKFCKDKEDLAKVLHQKITFEAKNPTSAYIYGAWAMEYPPRFNFFKPTNSEYGLMENGWRIASPGTIQRLISFFKQSFLL